MVTGDLLKTAVSNTYDRIANRDLEFSACSTPSVNLDCWMVGQMGIALEVKTMGSYPRHGFFTILQACPEPKKEAHCEHVHDNTKALQAAI
jgi:hypothetical protein